MSPRCRAFQATGRLLEPGVSQVCRLCIELGTKARLKPTNGPKCHWFSPFQPWGRFLHWAQPRLDRMHHASHILVVDDDREITELLAGYLSRFQMTRNNEQMVLEKRF